MSPFSRRAQAALALAAAATSFIGAESASGAQTVAGGLGYRVCATGRPVTTTVLEAESAFTNALLLLEPFRRPLGLDSARGRTSQLGVFPAGAELVVGMRVRETGDLFETGPAARNPDRMRHAIVRERAGSVVVGFEDTSGGGDRDFNDARLRVDGVSVARRCAEQAPVTARALRIGDHRHFVRVVADFSGPGVLAGDQLVGSDLDPFSDGVASVALDRSTAASTAPARHAFGLNVRIAARAGSLVLVVHSAPKRFTSVRYLVVHDPERLVLDLRKSK